MTDIAARLRLLVHDGSWDELRDCAVVAADEIEKLRHGAGYDLLVENLERDDAEIERLTAEVAEWQQAAQVEAGLRREAHDEIEKLRAALDACADYGDKQVVEIKRLHEALDEYGDHKFECEMKDTWQCSCGYTAVLRSAP
jgi:mRNA-degrading endonuclease YafQ of YafQ-DinJ toxin-antitoxin module